MLCYPFEEKRLMKWKPPYIVQPKLDGERCRAIPLPAGKYQLLSSECNEFISIPHINRALEEINIWPNEVDGELYTHGMSFDDIHSIVSRKVNMHPDYQSIQYHVFDLVNDQPQYQRLASVNSINIPLHIIQPVSIYIANTLDEIMQRYDIILASGYEGIVVRYIDAPYIRRRSLYMMKFKPKKDDYYKIVGFKEEVSIHGKPKGRLGALTCTSDGHEMFSVGSGLSDNDRENLWNTRENLKGKICHVKYQHITPGKGVPRFPVFIEIIDAEPKEVGLKL